MDTCEFSDNPEKVISHREFECTPPTVVNFYRLNHQLQTFDFVTQQLERHCVRFDKGRMTVWEALEKLDRVVDESDPDLQLPQIVHAFQTAEGLRKHYPDLEWLPLVGLIHDLGKVLALPEFGGQEQWATVGDTFPVGCQFQNAVVFHEFFELNPDYMHEVYSTRYGTYQPNCGFEKVLFSFGHDEYLYKVLVHNGCLLPAEGLYLIRYHSFYAFHTCGGYEHLMSERDFQMRDLCKKFSNCDLYTKSNTDLPDVSRLQTFYQDLIRKYFPDPLLSW